MIRIKQNSWHYRMWRWGHDSEAKPRNLCRYFWFCVLLIALPTIASALVLLGLGALVYVIYKNPVDAATIVGLIVGGVGFVMGVGFLANRSEKRRKKRGPQPLKEPSMARAYIAAKKSKVCPLIEIVDPDQ